MTTSIEQLHRAAYERGDLTYTDPRTGYLVFTALGLKRQGRCCGSGCRHCPYEHQAVNSEQRTERQPDPMRSDE